MKRTSLSLQMEAIAYQAGTSNNKLFPRLAEAYDNIIYEFRKRRVLRTKDLQNFDIEKIIFEETGIRTIQLVDEGIYNACVYPPLVDRNNPIAADFWVEFRENDDALQQIKKAKGAISGTVDLRNARVGGVFSEIVCEMHVGDQFFFNSKFTGAHIAAIMCHEIGHVHTYFEALSEVATINRVLQAVCTDVLKGADYERRLVLLTEAERVLGCKIDLKEEHAKMDKMEGYQILIIESTARKARSALGSPLYDFKSWEQSSDQFATRLGYGVHLAEALAEMHKLFDTPTYWSAPRFYLMEVFKWLFGIGLMIVPGYNLIFVLLLFMMGNPLWDVYDSPADRIVRIRRETLGELKNQKIDPKRRKTLLEDIEAMDRMLEGMKDRRTFYERVWILLSSTARSGTRQQRIQQELESLANNDLFLASAKLKELAS